MTCGKKHFFSSCVCLFVCSPVMRST
jgi:hypothetical protein